jgi:hypothetical protein
VNAFAVYGSVSQGVKKFKNPLFSRAKQSGHLSTDRNRGRVKKLNRGSTTGQQVSGAITRVVPGVGKLVLAAPRCLIDRIRNSDCGVRYADGTTASREGTLEWNPDNPH